MMDEGVYIGESIVTNRDGMCQVLAFNTREEEIEIVIPPQELLAIDFASYSSKEDIDHQHCSLIGG